MPSRSHSGTVTALGPVASACPETATETASAEPPKEPQRETQRRTCLRRQARSTCVLRKSDVKGPPIDTLSSTACLPPLRPTRSSMAR